MPTTVKEMLAQANAVVPRIDIAEARRIIDSGAALLLDVRDAPELEANGMIPGAHHVSRGMLEFRADPESPYHDPRFARDKPVLLYCASGGRSALSGKSLKDLGYEKVFNIGAFKDWVAAGGDIDKPIDKGM